MTILSNIANSSEVDYSKELPFYNKPIEKPKLKRLRNIDLLAELPFYEHNKNKSSIQRTCNVV